MKKFGVDFKEHGGKYYSELIEKDILKVIKRLKEGKSRFITATCFQNADHFFIFYHFEAGKKVLTFKTALKGNKAESIASLYLTASWIEREMTELYGIEFRSKNETLRLRSGQAVKSKKQKPLLLTPDIKTPFVDN